MKKNLLLIAFTLVFSQINAQLEKGNLQIGGSLTASASNYNYLKPTSPESSRNAYVSIAPTGGYFISNRSVIGMTIAYGNQSYEYGQNTYSSRYKTNTFSVGPYFRYYMPVMERLAFYAQCAATYGLGKTLNASDPANQDKTNYTSFDISLNPGITYFMNKRWAFESSFGSVFYSNSITRNENNPSGNLKYISHGAGINLSLGQFSLGLQYFINR